MARPQHTTPLPATKSDAVLFLVLAVLLVAPVLWVNFPPMADLPQHAAQVSILLDWHDAEPARDLTYRIDLFTPYLLAYGLVWLLAQVLPLLWALKVVIAGALLAFPWSVGRLLRRAGGPVELRWLAFPLALSTSFHWGFLNFLLATPLVVLFVELCLLHAEQPSRRTAWWVALGSVGLFFCHAIIGGLGGLVGGGTVALATPPRRWLARLAPFAAPLPFLAVWSSGLGSDTGALGDRAVWNVGLHRIGGLLAEISGWPAGPQRSAVGLALLGLPFVLGARPRRRLWRWWPFAACLALCLVWPELFLTTSRVRERFAVFLVPFLLLACRPGPVSRRGVATALAATLAGLLLVSQAAGTYSWQQQTRPFEALLGQMPPQKSVLALIFLAGNRISPAPVNASLVHWYLALNDGIRVDPALIDRFPFVVRYRDDALPDLPPGFPWRVHEFDWYRHGGERYDFVVALAPRDVGSRLFPPGTMELVAHEDSWYLYRARRESTDATAGQGALRDVVEQSAVTEGEDVAPRQAVAGE